MSQLHVITGKGGVGKSTLAAALAYRLAQQGEGPILLLEVQGSGRSLQLCGLDGPFAYDNTSLPSLNDSWGSRLLPRDTFRQYFRLLLTLGSENSSFAAATSQLREKLVDAVLNNKIVSAFIDVCPGLEPSVLLGKIHWEATEGLPPESQTPWKHVIVDAPATGHSLMLFRSTHALTEVFGSGLIFRQASRIMSFVQDPAKTRVYIVSTPEELPLQESLDIRAGFRNMQIPCTTYLINRSFRPANTSKSSPAGALESIQDPAWKQEISYELQLQEEQRELLEKFRESLTPQETCTLIPEFYSADPREIMKSVATSWSITSGESA